MRGLREDHQSCVKMDDGGHPEGSDCSAAPEGPQLHTSQESTTQEDCQTKLSISKDQGLSGVDCGSTEECKQTDDMPLISEFAATQSNATISVNEMIEGDIEIHSGNSEDKNTDPDREKVADIENILVPVPSTPDPSDPRSPAPLGQQHMRTQVSLEVVQCHSAATSPMTPPEGGNSFFFPSSFGKCGAVSTDTKDAELQVGHQVEFCSVATSPMTPKTPWTTAFPELIGKEEKVKKSEEQSKSFPETKSSAEAESETTDALKLTSSKELTEGLSASVSSESSPNCLTAGLRDSHINLEGTDQHCKQQRMGSMDQDITILVTQHGNNGEEEEDKTSFYSVEAEMVKIVEYEENKSDVMSTETAPSDPAQDASKTNQQSKSDDFSTPAGEKPKTSRETGNSGIKENKDAHEDRDFSVIKSPVPESPAPFGCHSIRTQVSLEVVQCQSAATSPMTPPEGDHAFCFPSTFGKCGAVGAETKDAELQVGQQVEFRSVATAPMTPRTPTATTFPDIKKEASIEEKIEEEEEDKKEQREVEAKEEVQNEEEKEEKVQAAKEEQKKETNVEEKGEEKCEEPVQEVSWDEKGMTWEVYGAVVEVAVLGSAIQKHLEKQVKKQKRQSNLPPPPPLNPSATPLASGSGSGKGRSAKRGEQDGKVSRRRRNPFRLLMENVQQPHCCSRAHTAE